MGFKYIRKGILKHSFSFVLAFFLLIITLILPSKVYACPETNLVSRDPVAGSSCVQSDFCGSVSNTCNKACGATGSINPIYDRRVLFTYTDNTTCESTVIFKSSGACEFIDLTQQATEISCVNTCNPSLAGTREGMSSII